MIDPEKLKCPRCGEQRTQIAEWSVICTHCIGKALADDFIEKFQSLLAAEPGEKKDSKEG